MSAELFAGVTLAVAAAVAVGAWLHRVRTARRIVAALDRMGARPADDTTGGAIAELERSVARVRARDVALAATELRLELALAEIGQGVVLTDEHGVVIFRNRVAERFAAARHSEALVRAAIDDLIRRATAGERGERTVDLYGPPPRQLVVSAAPLEADGRRLGAIAIVEDATERRRIEAVRRDFVANVSHELKTPIGALSLLAETLADETRADVVQRLSGRIRDEALRVSNMVDDLLTLSRIEARDEPDHAEFGVDLLVRECVDRVYPLAEQQGVAIVVQPVDADLTLVGDRRQLASALSNLLDNAVKYSAEGQSVIIRVTASADDVAIVVEDRGIGIPAGELERIFERFYRVDRARSRDTGGTGLGLAIARNVAHNHGGDISVVSREGEGSTFSIVLPHRAEPEVRERAVAKARDQHAPEARP